MFFYTQPHHDIEEGLEPNEKAPLLPSAEPRRGSNFRVLCLILLLVPYSLFWLLGTQIEPVRLTGAGDITASTLDVSSSWEALYESAYRHLLDNVHPEGSAPGVLVASPSRAAPDYYYHWTRDAAVCYRQLLDRMIAENDRDLLPLFGDYVHASAIMQHKNTAIGGFYTGGLGEAKYYTNLEPFTGPWGRPQNDGPASRALTLTKLTQYLLDNGLNASTIPILYNASLPADSIIKGDLEHISKHWREPSFDLWEEVKGTHFYTLLTIRAALTAGADLANRLDDAPAARYYLAQAAEISQVLRAFWDDEKQIIRVTINQADYGFNKYSSLDAAVPLAIRHSGHGTEFDGSDHVMSTIFQFIKTMKHVYPLNANLSTPALGRYPEDDYDGVGRTGANPWYICTLSMADNIYHIGQILRDARTPIVINTHNIGFFSLFLENATIGDTVEPSKKTMNRLIDYADGFVKTAIQFQGPNASMSEQFDRKSGVQRGATHLSWSYAAFMAAYKSRQDLVSSI